MQNLQPIIALTIFIGAFENMSTLNNFEFAVAIASSIVILFFSSIVNK